MKKYLTKIKDGFMFRVGMMLLPFVILWAFSDILTAAITEHRQAEK